MNAHDPDLGRPARLHYGDGDYVTLKPGDFVVCAVSGRRIDLDALRYWSAQRQEAYAGPAEYMQAAGLSQ